MSTNISLFPMLNEELLEKVQFVLSLYDFYYIRDEREYPLIAEAMEESSILHKLVDREGIWTPDEYNLCLRRTYYLKSCQDLFGENGIACSNAILGIALVWTSADSKQRGVIQVGEIKKMSKDIIFHLDYEFLTSQLRGSVEFTTILYIKNVGTPSCDESHLANEYGCVLGEIDKFIIKVDGTGSMFPIYEVNEIGEPLWNIKCDWDDPTYEQFSECVSININTAHKNYKYLDKTKKTFNEALIKEIIANALCIIITKLKEQENYWNVTINGEDLQSGSVSEAVYYFVSTLEWDIETPEKMSLSIRKYFDQRM